MNASPIVKCKDFEGVILDFQQLPLLLPTCGHGPLAQVYVCSLRKAWQRQRKPEGKSNEIIANPLPDTKGHQRFPRGFHQTKDSTGKCRLITRQVLKSSCGLRVGVQGHNQDLGCFLPLLPLGPDEKQTGFLDYHLGSRPGQQKGDWEGKAISS